LNRIPSRLGIVQAKLDSALAAPLFKVFLPLLATHLLLASCPTGELKVLGYIARYAPSKTDKNPIKSIGFALAFSKLPYGRAKGSKINPT